MSAGAARNLEAGESIRELVQTQTGQSAAANASAVMEPWFVSGQLGHAHRAEVKAGPHVLVATDRNPYAMTLSGPRLLDVGDVVLKTPLDQVDLRRGERELIVGGIIFNVMGLFGEHTDRLYDYVSRSSAASKA